MIKSQITDGKGRGAQAFVEDNALMVTLYGCPPLVAQKNKVYRAYLTDDGTTAGSNDMGIDASVAAVDFYAQATSAADRYITAINFVVGYGAASNLYHFADSTLVSDHNGFELYYEHAGEIVYIHDAIKTNADLVRLCVKDLLPTAWEARNFAALNDYGYMCTINVLELVPPYGIKLDLGTNQKLVFSVRDNNTDADVMNAIVYGFDRFP